MEDQNNNMNPGTEPAAGTPAPSAPAPNAATSAPAPTAPSAPTEPSTSGGSILSGAGKAAGAPEAYDFTSSLPEGMELDTDTASSFGEIAKGMNLTNEQANQIAKFGYEWAGKVGEAYQAEQQRQADANAAEAKKELGRDFEPTVAKAGVLMNYLERQIPGIRESFAGSPVFSSLPMIKAFALIGELVSEDRGIGGNPAPSIREDNPYPNTDWESLKR